MKNTNKTRRTFKTFLIDIFMRLIGAHEVDDNGFPIDN